jgi:hypothetical protein
MDGTNNDHGEEDDHHDDHREDDDNDDNDDDEALLDAFPLSLEELHRLQQAYDHEDHRAAMMIPDERLLTKMLQQSSPLVFCCRNNDPKSRWLETIVSVCGRRGDRFLLDMMGRLLIEPEADDDAVIESFVSLLLQECCFNHADHADGDGALFLSRWMPLFRSNMKENQKKKNEYDDNGILTTTTSTTKNWKDWLTHYLPGCSRVIAAAYSRHFCLAVTSPLVLPLTTTTLTSSSSSVDNDQQEKKLGSKDDHDHDDTTTTSTTTTRFLWHDDDDKNRRVAVATHIIDYQVALMGLGGRWHSLYESTVHGLSFFALQQHLLSFAGPTLLLIQTTNTNDDEILGVYTERAWKEPSFSCQNDDNDDDAASSFLFRLAPQWGVYRKKQQPTPTSTTSSSEQQQQQQQRKWQQSANHGRWYHHQYLNHHRHRGQNNQSNGRHLAGLAIGGITVDTPRIHLTLDLDEHCIARCYDGVFDDGDLLSSSSNDNDDDFSKNYYFTPARIQVWVRADETLHAHLRTGREWCDRREGARQRAATVVDKRPFVQDLLVDNAKVFAHRNHQMFPDQGGEGTGIGGG